jgi:hypothetical protein
MTTTRSLGTRPSDHRTGPIAVRHRSFARPGTCGCTHPLAQDPATGTWLHLADGSPCLPAVAATAG